MEIFEKSSTALGTRSRQQRSRTAREAKGGLPHPLLENATQVIRMFASGNITTQQTKHDTCAAVEL